MQEGATSSCRSRTALGKEEFSWLHFQHSLDTHWAFRVAILSVFLYHRLDALGSLAGFAEMADMPVAIATLVALDEAGGGILVFLTGWPGSVLCCSRGTA